jgi:hypothetical protein
LAIAAIGSATSAEDTTGTATSKAVTCPSTSSGELLIVPVSRFIASPGTLTISDNIGGATGWTRVGTAIGTAAAGWIDLFFNPNSSAGVTTITVSTGTGSYITLGCQRFSGAATASAQDGAEVTNTGVGTAISGGTYTPSVAGTVVIFAMSEGDTGTITNTWSGSTLALNVDPTGGSGQPLWLAFQVIAGTTAQTPTATMSLSAGWQTKTIGIKAAAGGGGGGRVFGQSGLDGLSIAGPKQFNPLSYTRRDIDRMARAEIARLERMGARAA